MLLFMLVILWVFDLLHFESWLLKNVVFVDWLLKKEKSHTYDTS